MPTTMKSKMEHADDDAVDQVEEVAPARHDGLAGLDAERDRVEHDQPHHDPFGPRVFHDPAQGFEQGLLPRAMWAAACIAGAPDAVACRLAADRHPDMLAAASFPRSSTPAASPDHSCRRIAA
jgi:hypothetical protein